MAFTREFYLKGGNSQSARSIMYGPAVAGEPFRAIFAVNRLRVIPAFAGDPYWPLLEVRDGRYAMEGIFPRLRALALLWEVALAASGLVVP